jgi:hypothetical protein
LTMGFSSLSMLIYPNVCLFSVALALRRHQHFPENHRAHTIRNAQPLKSPWLNLPTLKS